MPDFKAIEEAYKFIKNGGAKRIDGEGFKVYAAGRIIRIDIEEETE